MAMILYRRNLLKMGQFSIHFWVVVATTTREGVEPANSDVTGVSEVFWEASLGQPPPIHDDISLSGDLSLVFPECH